ncbi:MAG: hypothetical protein JSR65_05450 [Proteobacteria bacterium]|nr:hypothetical protein [Pseudomonadota bacterium]
MPSAVEIFRDILLLRRGPQDLPCSTQLLSVLAIACIAAQAIVRTIPAPVGLGESLLSSTLEIGLIVSALRLVLRLRGLGNRFVQAASGLLGVNLVFTLINLPVVLVFGRVPIEAGRIVAEQITPTQMLLSPLILVLGLWQLAVNAHVLRHSLNLSFAGGIAVIFGWIVLLSLLLSFLVAPQGV